jgi:hypothetical protein
MLPPLSRLSTFLLLINFLGMEGCAHLHQGSSVNAKAPAILSEDSPRAHGGTNPNAPYTMASAKPQLVKRASAADTARLQACDGDQLEITEISAAMNDNYRAVKLAFSNKSTTPCRLGGYPTIQLEDAHGLPVASVVVDKVTTSTLSAELSQGLVPASAIEPGAQVNLTANGEAWFQMGWKTAEGCPIISRISVSAPDSQKSFTVNRPLTVCEGRIQVTTLHSDSSY